MLQKSVLDDMFERLSLQMTKRADITVCGGASIVLNYGTRDSTMDVDCLLLERSIKKQSEVIAEELGVDVDWINDNVSVTESYSDRLISYRERYKVFNDKLYVYTIKGLPLLCMKLVSFREHTSDVEDCLALMNEIKDTISMSVIKDAIYDIYGDTSRLSVDAEMYIEQHLNDGYKLDNESINSYIEMINCRLLSKEDIPEPYRQQVVDKMNSNGVDNALSKLCGIGG